MRWVRFAVLVLVATVLQASLVSRFALSSLAIKPDLLLILLVFFSLHGVSRSKRTRPGRADLNVAETVITSFAIGFAADIIGTAMGPRMLSFGVFGTLLAYLQRIVAIRKMLYQSLAIFIAGVIIGFSCQLLTRLKIESAGAGISTVVFWSSLYSAVLGPLLFVIAGWWMRIKPRWLRRR